MGKVHERIDARLRAFLESQPVFFVATAPTTGGHVNVSPKGVAGTFVVVDEHTVAYVDLTASGAETIAQVRQNGRITLMFCSFDRRPNVVRLHGTGRVVSTYDVAYADWAARFDETRGARAVIVVDVHRVSDSCGYGVPLMKYLGEREGPAKGADRSGDAMLPAHAARKGEDGLRRYRRLKNRTSLDGLPAFDDDPA